MTSGRVMALDVGDRRIGVAISDPLRITVRALATVERGRGARTIMFDINPPSRSAGARPAGGTVHPAAAVGTPAAANPDRDDAGPDAGAQRAGRPAPDVAAVLDLVAAWAPAIVVVGDPRMPSGDRGEQAEATDAFVTRLVAPLAQMGVPIDRWDESYTSEAARERLKARGIDTRRDKAAVDAEAAAIILEDWLRARP